MDTNLEKYKKSILHSQKYNIILYFFIFAFLGWVLESFFSLYALGHFTKRGFLYGPICPIYGYAAIMLITFLNKYKKNSLKLFFYSIIIFSVFEYIVGYALDALFMLKCWDYTNEFLNLNGRISIFYSFAWGVISILFINHIFPFMQKKVEFLFSKIPYSIQLTVIKLFSILFALDTLLSCAKYFIK